MSSKTFTGTALAVLLGGVVLAGCGSNIGHNMSGGTNGMSTAMPTAPASGQPAAHDDADVAFAQQMIPHHAQAIDMSKLVARHTGNAKVIDLAARIQQAQGPEIQQMTGWLHEWGTSPSGTGMSGMNHSMPGMTSGQSMPGMASGAPMTGIMSADEMAKLGQAKGSEFDRMWLQMMISHHQGAVDMSRTELAKGNSTDAKALAQKIIDGQQAEITEMRGLLGHS